MIEKKWIAVFLLLSCLLQQVSLRSQVLEDFTDGNFTNNPAWTGTDSNFEVNTAKQLHLKGSGTDSACLATPSFLLDSTEWFCWVKLSFSPSANNFARFYLCSDQQDLRGPLNGFYLQLGEAGSADALELFRQEGSVHYSVCRGQAGLLASSFNIRVRVCRDLHGNWKIYADPSGAYNFGLQASGLDACQLTPLWSGFYCKYTSSNATKFYFDEIAIRPILLDLTAPALEELYAENCQTLYLLFNESLDPQIALNPDHYVVNQGIGNPIAVSADPLEPRGLLLEFVAEFLGGNSYSIDIDSVIDLAGNCLASVQQAFVYYSPRFTDVVFNEIMADPEPQVGLPPFEYLELLNRSAYPVLVKGWELHTGSTVKLLPAIQLQAGSYLILADSSARPFLSVYGNFLGFPSFSLSNGGSSLVLADREGRVIHSVAYSDDWYGDPLKSAGGWSLEQLDPSNPCAGKGNWTASQAKRGGSPGSQNSVQQPNPDNQPPSLARIEVLDQFNIRVHLSEKTDSTCLSRLSAWQTTPPGLPPLALVPVRPDYDKVDLTLAKPVLNGMVYQLSFHDTLRDCTGNQTTSLQSLPFGFPHYPEAGDVLINEVLFNPRDGGPEFVEVLNVSDKILDLRDMLLCKTDTLTGSLLSVHEISKGGRLWFPGQYYALTTDPAMLAMQYFSAYVPDIIQAASFPSLPNEGGCIALTDRSYLLLDQVVYAESMHFSLLSQTAGVSLERISPAQPSLLRQNWHSASSACAYATPAAKNSQGIGMEDFDQMFSLSYPIFSPDNDGYQDILGVFCQMEKGGYVANIQVYNARGQLIKTLASQQLLGTSDSFFWDGLDNRGLLAPIGAYAIVFQLYSEEGKVLRHKKAAVLGGKL